MTHLMQRVEVYPSGAEEWQCQTCDRHLLILVWHPDAKGLEINPGDNVSHTWEKDEVRE